MAQFRVILIQQFYDDVPNTKYFDGRNAKKMVNNVLRDNINSQTYTTIIIQENVGDQFLRKWKTIKIEDHKFSAIEKTAPSD